MNQLLIQSQVINQAYSTSTVSLKSTTRIKEIGTFSVTKVLKLIGLCARLVLALIKRPNLVYFTLTPSGGAFYRDMILVAIVKVFGFPLIYHLHGLGIRKRYHDGSALDRFLLNMALKNVSVICLSNRMAVDVEPVVDTSS